MPVRELLPLLGRRLGQKLIFRISQTTPVLPDETEQELLVSRLKLVPASGLRVDAG
jgi:hypothetical protein